ncbi:sensor histidine kinase [Flavisolibacter ginsenosidimutans]|nr:histidine kinase [Flavisolibacter ginsenosidimutans]
MNRNRKMVVFHILGWALFCALVVAFVRGFGQSFSSFGVLFFLMFVLVYAALFYTNALLLLPRFYFRKNYLAYFGAIFLLLVAVYFSRPFENLVLHRGEGMRKEELRFRKPPPDFDLESSPEEERGKQPLRLDIVSVVLFVAVLSVSSVQQIVRQWQTSERRAAQAEADKVTAELLFLKAQINPHFLFNTLNNIYSLAITKSEHTPDAVLKLSSILRYLTDDVRHDFVPLPSEVNCVRNYIELQKLRINRKVTLEFAVEGNIEDKKIAPLLFMTFIENAFKYGISSHEACTISIHIRADERSIHLFCKNRIFDREEEETMREGVGISNAKKRLAYLYPEKYLLNIDTQKEHFTVDLMIIT